VIPNVVDSFSHPPFALGVAASHPTAHYTTGIESGAFLRLHIEASAAVGFLPKIRIVHVVYLLSSGPVTAGYLKYDRLA